MSSTKSSRSNNLDYVSISSDDSTLQVNIKHLKPGKIYYIDITEAIEIGHKKTLWSRFKSAFKINKRSYKLRVNK